MNKIKKTFGKAKSVEDCLELFTEVGNSREDILDVANTICLYDKLHTRCAFSYILLYFNFYSEYTPHDFQSFCKDMMVYMGSKRAMYEAFRLYTIEMSQYFQHYDNNILGKGGVR